VSDLQAGTDAQITIEGYEGNRQLSARRLALAVPRRPHSIEFRYSVSGNVSA
jgi:hypothetical protein